MTAGPYTQMISAQHPSDQEPRLKTSVKFRIYELMAEQGIKSVAALHRRMIEMRVPVSHSQLLRIVDNRADHWKVQYINAFLEIFNCQVADLFKVELRAEHESKTSNAPSQESREQALSTSRVA